MEAEAEAVVVIRVEAEAEAAIHMVEAEAEAVGTMGAEAEAEAATQMATSNIFKKLLSMLVFSLFIQTDSTIFESKWYENILYYE